MIVLLSAASYGGEDSRHNFFPNSISGLVYTNSADEVKKLQLKHELLEFGEFSLQAMGYYAE